MTLLSYDISLKANQDFCSYDKIGVEQNKSSSQFVRELRNKEIIFEVTQLVCQLGIQLANQLVIWFVSYGVRYSASQSGNLSCRWLKSQSISYFLRQSLRHLDRKLASQINCHVGGSKVSQLVTSLGSHLGNWFVSQLSHQFSSQQPIEIVHDFAKL